jgi:hypothetical protein
LRPLSEGAVLAKATVEIDPCKVDISAQITELDSGAAALPVY